jgi:adenylate cyclase
MRDDEEATVRDIAAHRVLISDIIQQHHGRVVDSPGDNILAEFASVVDAVNGAIKIQAEIKRSNADTPEDRRMEFRIGINLGDVIEEEERIYGDGVNIAARVEGLASAGGIAISGTVYEHIKDKLSLGYHYLGEQDVKNIPEPVRVYRLLTEPGDAGKLIGAEKKASKKKWIWAAAAAVLVAVVGLGIWQFYLRPQPIEPASEEKMAFPLPDKPSIAVLPFDNMSGDPEQEYFSDGITEQIITGLSNIPKLFVMSRNATFTYKGKPVKPKQVAEELGVQYLLEGSVQRSGERIRVTAQLIDALAGHHLWAEKYDRELNDIFALQDEITFKIMTAMRVKLTSGEQASVLEKGTKNLNAYFKYLKAREHIDRNNKEDNVIAQKLLQEAITLDPKFALAHSLLGAAYLNDVYLGLSKNPKVSIAQAIKLTKKAIELDESLARPHALLAFLYVLTKQYEKAAAKCEQALELGPNDERAHFLVGMTMRFAGMWAEAIPVYEKAIRLNPFPQSNTYYGLGLAYCFTGQFEKGIEACQRATQGNPNDLYAHVVLTAAYGMAGREEEAQATAEKVLKIDPKFTVKTWEKGLRLKNQSDKERYVEELRGAGLPYEPPLPLPDKPSIAVLAFDNLSGDPEQEYFSDGISEEIINALSKTDQLFVIARNSSFTYKGKPVDVKQVSRELGVRYVLEGSVRKSEDRVRITAQLIDATTGNHLWSERYDRDLKDIFAVQDEITMKIVTALQIELTEGEQMRMMATGYKSLDVLLKAMELMSLWRKGTVESHMRHGQIAQEVVDMAPELPIGYRNLGWYHWFLANMGKQPQENLKKAFKLAKKAISLDESDATCHALLGAVYSNMRQHEKAIAAGERSIELDPNGAMVHLLLGQSLNYAGRPEEAIAKTKKGIRLNPFPNYMYYRDLGNAYNQMGQYEKALTEYKKALQLVPESPWVIGGLAITYSLLDRQEEARALAAKCVELAPFVSVSFISKTSRYKNQEHTKRIADAMRKAGFPEGT